MIRQRIQPSRQARGFTIVELMVALLLGLIVVGGVLNVFVANKQSQRGNQALTDVQDAARVAFELMARDIREMGMTGCGNASVTNATNSPTAWWGDWNQPLSGNDDASADPVLSSITGDGSPIASATDLDSSSIQVLSVSGFSASFKAQSDLTATSIALNESTATFSAGDLVLVCTPETALIGQLSAASAGSITFAAEGAGTPGNSGAITETFDINSLVTPLNAVTWHLGTNPIGGTSLYRRTLVAGIETSQEMVRNIAEMDVLYHIRGGTSYVDAATVAANWPTVDAVRITLTPETTMDQETLSRPFSTTIALRGRLE